MIAKASVVDNIKETIVFKQNRPFAYDHIEIVWPNVPDL